jgi:acetyltransferase-like isoleucine patch superfamily enzyme
MGADRVTLAAKKSAFLFRAVCIARELGVSLRFAGRDVTVGRGSWVSWRSVVRTNSGGSIRIGNRCDIHPFAMLLTHGGNIRIGDNCSVNPFTLIYGCGGISIGNGVRIAAHVVIIPESHNHGTDALPLHQAGTTRKGICIGDNVWIGAGAKILDGVTIGRNCVVGAGAVVNRSLPDGVTAVGVPAKPVAGATALNACDT